jgi:D-amino-acid oxidase
MSRDIAVVGAGVIGLTTAVELLRAGHRVTIFARERSAYTTSAVPAAIWFPYHAQPEADVVRWALATRERLRALVDEPRAGVRWVDFSRVWKDKRPPVEKWMDELTWLSGDELPNGFCYGYKIPVPLMENPAYLTYLQSLFDGEIVIGELQSLADIPDAYETIVNCTGYGAKALCNDPELTPGRGVVVLAERIASERHVVHDEPHDSLMYVVSRSGDCVLGGCDEPNDVLATSRAEAEAILRRCVVVGDCADVRLRSVEVGIRPVREIGVRLAAETMADGRTVVHNYGHGGSGFTLSWGCAEDVAALVDPPC